MENALRGNAGHEQENRTARVPAQRLAGTQAGHWLHARDSSAALGRTRAERTLGEKRATVRDLLESKSGVYRVALYETARERRMRPARGSHPPGTFWYYNNRDFNALGTLYEKAAGKSIFAAFESEIASPLEMQDYRISDGEYDASLRRDHARWPWLSVVDPVDDLAVVHQIDTRALFGLVGNGHKVSERQMGHLMWLIPIAAHAKDPDRDPFSTVGSGRLVSSIPSNGRLRDCHQSACGADLSKKDEAPPSRANRRHRRGNDLRFLRIWSTSS